MKLAWIVLSMFLTAPPEGGVIGLRAQDGRLSTLWVGASGITHLGDGLAVPRRDGWWRLARVRSGDANNYVDRIVVHKHGSPTPSIKPPDKGCEQQSSLTLLFVSPDWVAVEDSSGGYCEGAAHPWAMQTLTTWRFEQAGGRSTPIGEALGKQTQTAMLRAGAAARRKQARLNKARGRDTCLDEPRPTGWGLIRKRGHWIVRGALAHENEACRGQYHYYSANVVVPAEFSGPDTLTTPWKALQKRFGRLSDAVQSPRGSLTVLLDKDGLRLQHNGVQIGSYAAPRASLVMAQWASGTKNVARWTRDSAAVVRAPARRRHLTSPK